MNEIVDLIYADRSEQWGDAARAAFSTTLRERYPPVPDLTDKKNDERRFQLRVNGDTKDRAIPYAALFPPDQERRRTKTPGLYVLEYAPGHTAYVISGREYLASLASDRRDHRYADAVFRSATDKEWLVMPADPIDDRGTLSALLRKCDNLVADHYVAEDYVPDYGSTATFL